MQRSGKGNSVGGVGAGDIGGDAIEEIRQRRGVVAAHDLPALPLLPLPRVAVNRLEYLSDATLDASSFRSGA